MLDAPLLYSVSHSRSVGLVSVRERRAVFHPEQPAARRWAGYISRATEAPHDPRTLEEWGRAAGVSRSVLIESCARLDVSPRDARDLARVLRLVRRVEDQWEPELALDIADRRTLRALLDRAGLENAAGKRRPTLEEFLVRQRFVPQTSPGLDALRSLLGRAAHVAH